MSLTASAGRFTRRGESGGASAQTPFDPPRLPDGRPDLQGVWDFRTLTPLERPEALADKAVFGAEEVAEIEARAAAWSAAANAPTTGRTELPVGGDVGAYNSFWMDQGGRVVDDQRTSLIVDPPNGRVPPLQPGVEMQILSLSEDVGGAGPDRTRSAGISADDPRCPHRAARWARPLPERIRQWTGDSRGYWEGDTLVVETTNFTGYVRVSQMA